MDIANYKFTYQQLNPVTWQIGIRTPDDLNFITIAQCNGRPNDLDIFNQLIVNKEGRKNLILEMQENKDYWIIKEEPKKEEIKNEPEPVKIESVASGVQ